MSESNNNNESCCFDQPKTASDYFMFFSMGSVLIGLVIFCVGYLVPRDHVKDPNLSAREQETLAMQYANEENRLDWCVIAGMVFIGLGGIVTSAVFCNSVICGECGTRVVGDDRFPLTTGPGANTIHRDPGYGAVEGASELQMR